MIQKTQYRQLHPEGRMTMARIKQQRFIARVTARALNRSPSRRARAARVLLAKMDDATAASAMAGFPAKQNPITSPLRTSFTYDQGRVTSLHVVLAAQTAVKVYFCDRHSSK